MPALQLDPELVAPLAAWKEATGGGIDLHDIARTRKTMEAFAEMMAASAKPRDDVSTQDLWVAGPVGAPEVFVRIYTPVERIPELPALVWLHGGGHVLGSVAQDDLIARRLCAVGECVVVSVDYRLAPEHPFPAGLEDAHAALVWLAANAREFGVDSERIAVGGASAGGGLAAGLAQLARDRAQVAVSFQMLIYPMLDNLTTAAEDVEHPDTHVWTRENNRMAWRAYLGETAMNSPISPYAAPARAEDLSGLPPAYIPVGDMDLFLHENISYAERLMSAGVRAELRVYPGGFHGFNGFAPGAAISKRFNVDRDAVLRRMLHP